MKTCKTCSWYVHETEIDNYVHDENVTKDCFCLMLDLFTSVEPNDKACSSYNPDNKGEKLES